MSSAVLDSWVNGATVIAGILAACVRPLRLIRRKRRGTYAGRCWQTPRVIMDCLTGATFVPFAVMAASAFLPAFIPLLTANKGALAIAGVVGGIAVAGEILTAGRDD